MRPLFFALLLALLGLAGCSSSDTSQMPWSESIMPVLLSGPGSDWDLHTTMMGDTVRIVIGKSGEEDVELFWRITEGRDADLYRVVCQVEIMNRALADALIATVDRWRPGFMGRPLFEPDNYNCRWLAYWMPADYQVGAALYSTMRAHGLALNALIGARGEHLPNGPFDRQSLCLWFITPQELCP